MTPDEIVACVDRMRALADIAERHTRPMMCGHYRETDPETAARYARIAFHEAAKLLDFCAPKTCGLSEIPVDWRHAALRVGEAMAGTGPDGYYDYGPSQWAEWALAQVERACAPKTCGTCAHVLVRPGHGDFGDWLRCGCEYAPAYLADVTYTECCRSWRRKDGAQ